jgi:N-acetyl-anhydromuramyl-L-alanine amidase AmpD
MMVTGYKIKKIYTPNQMDRKDWIPDIIVSHITEGGYLGAIDWLTHKISQASSHFVVSQKGEITQLVDIREAAWINGTRTDPSEKNYYGNSSLKIVRDRKTNANYYSIGIEHEGYYHKAKGKLTYEQLEATIWLHHYIVKEVKRIYGTDIILDREHIAGHCQVDPLRKPNCPGEAFQFEEVLEKLKGAVAMGKVFKDVEDDRWSAKHIEAAEELGLLKGIKEDIDFDGVVDSVFKPTKMLTREQGAVLVVRLYEKITGEKVV